MHLTVPVNHCPITIEIDSIDLFIKYSNWQRLYSKGGLQLINNTGSYIRALKMTWTHTVNKLASGPSRYFLSVCVKS